MNEISNEKVERPWGYYINLYGDDNSGYRVKKIVVNVNGKLSLQTHDQRVEHWVIVKGVGRVVVGENCFSVGKGIHVYIPRKMLHRIENIGEEDLELIETQIGEYLGEDDIIRYEDVYNRA